MMRRCLAVLLALAMLMTGGAWAESAMLTLDTLAETIRPGKAVLISFDAPQAGSADLLLTDGQGQTLSVAVQGYAATAGRNSLWWNGTYQGQAAPQGSWQLTLTLNGETVSVPVKVGGYAPYLANMSLDTESAALGETVTASFYASADGLLTVGIWQDNQHYSVETVSIAAGEDTYAWNTSGWEESGLKDGAASLTLTLTDETGFSSNEEHLALELTGFGAAEDVQPATEPDALPELTEEQDPAQDEGLSDMVQVPVNGAAAEDTLIVDDVIVGGHDQTGAEEPLTGNEAEVFTPAHGSPYTDSSLNYWTLPMDITDEEAVWEVLMQPMTVIYSSKKNAEKTQAVVYAEPSEDSEGVGVVTRITQGVHVLEQLDNGWSLIECYSASFHDSKVKRWNQLIQGYVPTDTLKEVTPQQEYGLVVDKLTQRLYIFKEGKLFSTLLVSTGLTNAEQPYNETRSGEFLLQNPAVGAFASGNLTCAMGIRFNSGDLLHEVPYATNADGTKNYGYTEPSLGTKASHGCIRVQRNKTPEGINMYWLWKNRENNTKILIWEDWQGRQIPIPEDDFQLYYNPNGGSMYHSQETCNSTKDGITFTAFNYSELDTGDFAKLKRCNYCAPVLRRADIEAINEAYAPGGDHDPILTKAREDQLKKEGKLEE